MNRQRFEELKLTGALPSPAGVGLRILAITHEDDFCLDDLAHTIQSDPALTGRLLKLANSSLHAGSEPARNVRDASMRMGVRSVRNIALSFTLVSGNRSGTCRAFAYEAYWSHSLAVAVAARVLARHAGRPSPTDAFTCGLLSGIGRLALAAVHPDRYEQVLLRARAEGGDLAELEREAFDADHRELGAALLEDWCLPHSFTSAVACFEVTAPQDVDADHEAQELTGILRMAARLARVELFGADELLQRELVDLASTLGLQAGSVGELGAELRQQWHEWGQVLEVPTHRPSDESRAQQGEVDPFLQDVVRRRGLRILAVDDDVVSLRLLSHHLQRDGHVVTLAHDGRQGLELAMRDAPQMVVTDWTMPEMDGLELCKALRRTREMRGIYILVLTGRGDHQRIVEAFDAGADDYVNKPFDADVLLARVRAGQRMIELREQVEADRLDRARQLARMAVLNRKLKTAAMTDILTRLPNRRYAMGRLEQEVSAARRGGEPLCVIMIDIDHFKSVNDRFGHDTGDRVLQQTAEVLKRSIRKGDVPARLGGEEFLVICPASDLEGTTLVAQRIRDAVAEHDFDGFPDRLTISLGVAMLDARSGSVDALLKEADRCVYLAKARGRDQVCAGIDADQDGRQSGTRAS